MSRRISLGSQFQKLDAIKKLPASRSTETQSSLDEREATSEADSSLASPEPFSALRSLNGEERLTSMDTVKNEQCEKWTVSPSDPVQFEQYPKQTVSKTDTVELPKDTAVGPVENYTRISNELLRSHGLFSEPVDFMVYLHLYSYSYGFGRKTASMSQAQLEKFTSSSKNTIKRSLDRLVSEGWIKLVDEYEHGRVSRSWKVFRPEDRRPSGRPGRGAKTDSVQNGHCPEFTGRVSNLDTPTVSKMDTYKERRIKENRNTLSLKKISETNGNVLSESELPENLKTYFVDLRPERKRLSEWQSLESLRLDYPMEQIASALNWIQANGVPGSGESCHSPVAFLASGAIQRVIGLVREMQEKQAKISARAETEARAERYRREKELREAREAEVLEAAFSRAFPTAERQREVIGELCRGMPFSSHGQTARVFAIGRWWDSLNRIEKAELTEGVVVLREK